MSFLTEVEALGTKVENFIATVVKGTATLQKIWGALSGPTLAAAAAVFYDVVTTLSDADSAAQAAATGNVLSTVTLSQTTITAVQKVIADAKAGEATVVADFKALDLKF